MLERRFFHNETLLDFFSDANVEKKWRKIAIELPFTYESLWQVLASKGCQSVIKEKGWDNSEGFLRLRQAIVTLFWGLGDNVATELLYIGRTQVLTSLMTLEEDIFTQHKMCHGDLQTYLLLTTVQRIGKSQHPTDPAIMAVTILEDLDIPAQYKECLVEYFIRKECRQRSTWGHAINRHRNFH